MISSAVSDALNYQALCVAAKSEERKLDELQKRKHYQSPQLRGTKKATNQPQISTAGSQLKPGQSCNRSSGPSQSKQGQSAGSSTDSRTRKCWNCEENGHMAYNCPKLKRALADQTTSQVSTKMVSSIEIEILKEIMDDPLLYLLSESDDLSYVRHVRIQDQGSKPQKAKVVVGGVPISGSN